MAELPKDRAGWLSLVRRVQRGDSSHDAEDALQSAYIRLEEYRSRTPVENPVAFLVRTAMNIGVDQNRRSRVRGELDDRDAALADLIDEQPLQDEALVARQRLAYVQVAIDRLPPRTREVVLMNRVEELKYSEIAQRLGMTVSGVEKHMAKAVLQVTRARRNLK